MWLISGVKPATLPTLFSGHFESWRLPLITLILPRKEWSWSQGHSAVSHGSNAVNCKRSSDQNCVIDHAWCLIGADKILRSLPLVRGSSASCPTSSKRSPSWSYSGLSALWRTEISLNTSFMTLTIQNWWRWWVFFAFHHLCHYRAWVYGRHVAHSLLGKKNSSRRNQGNFWTYSKRLHNCYKYYSLHW